MIYLIFGLLVVVVYLFWLVTLLYDRVRDLRTDIHNMDARWDRTTDQIISNINAAAKIKTTLYKKEM